MRIIKKLVSVRLHDDAISKINELIEIEKKVIGREKNFNEKVRECLDYGIARNQDDLYRKAMQISSRMDADRQEPKGKTQKKVEVLKEVDRTKIDFSGVGRNDHCPCGSGKKFKHCHGK